MDHTKEKAARGNERRCDAFSGVRLVKCSEEREGCVRFHGYTDCLAGVDSMQRHELDITVRNVLCVEEVCAAPNALGEYLTAASACMHSRILVWHHGKIESVNVNGPQARVRERIALVREGGAA